VSVEVACAHTFMIHCWQGVSQPRGPET
jgi:predicted protein tyrosine phosphatase